ncbi:MAG: hypothetical protein FJ224_12180 [Lentisphaerae bacterium]|nr:hypothetical protein [Lentisphaerota bacterium]
MNQIMSAFRWIALVAPMLVAVVGRAGITLTERVATTPRHVFTLGDTGLPEQLAIRAATNDVPLAWRAEKEWPDALLSNIGRGPQLASPMRLEAMVDGLSVVVKAEAPAVLSQHDHGVEAVAKWRADKLKGNLRVVYAEDGSMTWRVTYDATETDLDRLDLVIEIAGPVDTAIAGNPVALAVKEQMPAEYGTLDTKPGVVWLNGRNPKGDGNFHQEQVSHFFLGNGDRGFTWLAGDGLEIDRDESSIGVELTSAKVTRWRIALVNKSARRGEATATFTILTHPARSKADDRRLVQWQVWPGQAATPGLTAGERSTCKDELVRADAGSVCEAAAKRALLEGAAGGEALGAAATVADRFPLGLFRYLAAPHTALTAQVRPNSAALTSAGASPAPDRVVLGRALLHDIGVDLRGLARRVEAANVLRALDEFGYFENDGKTEFLPYWRTRGIFQYGEAFEDDLGFATTTENPTARTRVSAFIRPTKAEKVRNTQVIRRKTLFVLVNEGTNAVRDYLYIWNPNYVFAGPNRLQAEHIYSQLDFSRIAPDGDWQRNRVERTLPELIKDRAGRATGLVKMNGIISRHHMSELMDVESVGIVRIAEREVQFAKEFYGDDLVKNGFQMYGPIYVPARGMRLLFGEGFVDLPNGVAGRVVDAKTGKPLSVPVHIFSGQVKESDTLDALKAGKDYVATVESDKDGRFRWTGFTAGTILAEVDGKVFPTRPQVSIRNDGGVVGDGAPHVRGRVDAVWPMTANSQQWPNRLPDRVGKWVDVLIEVDL